MTMTAKKIETALDVLLWLSEEEDSEGELRDDISRVRDRLWDKLPVHGGKF